MKGLLSILLLLLIAALGLYPWLAMEANVWRIPALLIAGPASLLFLWTLYAGDLKALIFLVKKTEKELIK